MDFKLKYDGNKGPVSGLDVNDFEAFVLDKDLSARFIDEKKVLL